MIQHLRLSQWSGAGLPARIEKKSRAEAAPSCYRVKKRPSDTYMLYEL